MTTAKFKIGDKDIECECTSFDFELKNSEDFEGFKSLGQLSSIGLDFEVNGLKTYELMLHLSTLEDGDLIH